MFATSLLLQLNLSELMAGRYYHAIKINTTRMKINLNKIFRLFLACMAWVCLLLMAACEKEVQTLPDLDIDHADYSFSAFGGIDTLSVLSVGDWTALSDADWLRLSPANGVGITECLVVADTSYAYADREAKLQIMTNSGSKTIEIAQKGFPKQITLSDTQVSLSDQNDPMKMFFEVEVTANVPWRIQYDQSEHYWINYETNNNVGSAKPVKSRVRFEYDINSMPAQRNVNILFEAVNGDVETVALNVTQKAAPLIEPSRRGDSLAVVAMVRSLNASSFDISKRMEYWQGVEIENDRIVELDIRFIETDRSLPYEVQFLTELRKLAVRTNGNAFLRRIKLGPEVAKLEKLEVLELFSYGISELDDAIGEMPNLRELRLSGNTFSHIPMEILKRMPALKVVDFVGNRRWSAIDLSNYPDELSNLGLHGSLPPDLFEMQQLEEINLSYNHFEGIIPESQCGMPNLKVLRLNLNRFTGEIPQWILNHPNVCGFDPYLLIFNQEGRDSQGDDAGFINVPEPEDLCPLITEDEL